MSFREVLPSILLVLGKLSAESYLKDKGSAYRYSQTFKLQLVILENLGKVLIHLDIGHEKLNEVMDTVFKYMSNKQPVPLQVLELFQLNIFAQTVFFLLDGRNSVLQTCVIIRSKAS